MKKIVFGITSLTLGGAERVLVDMVNKLKAYYDITIFTLYAKGSFEKAISNNIKIISLYDNEYKQMSRIKKIWISARLLLFKNGIYKKYIKDKFDVEIAFLEGPITRLFNIKNEKVKKIVWVHNDISKVFGNNVKSKIKKQYDRNIYNAYEKIIFVSKDNLEKFKEIYNNIQQNKLQLIYNYIDKDNVQKLSKNDVDIEFDKETINFVTVARLVEQKAIDRFLDVHKKLIDNGLKNNVYVIGEGPKYKELEEKININKLYNTFKLLGKKENPYPYINKADVFCLLSYYEGYGMVLEEAKILNKHIVITNTAAREALTNYEKGIIVDNNSDSIYKALEDIINNKSRYKNNTNMQNSYNNQDILEQIKNVID